MLPLLLSQPRRAAGVALLAAAGVACGGRPAAGPAPVEPEAAVRTFLNAVHANSLTGMAAVWGTDKGPAVQWMDRQEMDKRLTIMRSYLVHDSFVFQPRNTMDAAGRDERVLDVRLTRKNCQPVVPFTVVRWGAAWLVKSVDLSAAGNPARPCGPGGGPAPLGQGPGT